MGEFAAIAQSPLQAREEAVANNRALTDRVNSLQSLASFSGGKKYKHYFDQGHSTTTVDALFVKAKQEILDATPTAHQLRSYMTYSKEEEDGDSTAYHTYFRTTEEATKLWRNDQLSSLASAYSHQYNYALKQGKKDKYENQQRYLGNKEYGQEINPDPITEKGTNNLSSSQTNTNLGGTAKTEKKAATR